MVNIGSSSKKEGSSGYSMSWPTKVDVWSPEMWSAFQKLSPMLTGGISSPAPSYPGMMYTPRTPEEQQYLNYTTGNAATRPEAVERAFTGKAAYDITPEATEDYYQSAIRAPALREFQQVTLPNIKEAFVGPAYYGSRRMEEQSRAGENLAVELARQRADLGYKDELARRESLEKGADRMIQYGVPQMGTAGQMARQIENEQVLADLSRWLGGEVVDGKYNAAYNPYVQLVFQMLGLSPYAVGQTTIGSQTSSGSGSSWGLGVKI